MKENLIDFSGVTAFIFTLYLKVLEYFKLSNVNDIILGITGFLTMVYIYYKVRMIIMDFRKRKKEERDEAKNNK